ncbi:hypothetical protein [Latilactobacillus sakei]|nr:hypothetical protein [Latilactobacillus sakei]
MVKVIKKNNKLIGIIILFVVLSIFYTYLMAPQHTLIARDSLDGYFHLNRALSLRHIWYSPINFNDWGGVGNATALFYPWLTIYPMHLLTVIFGPVSGFLLSLTLVTFLTLVSSYISAIKFSGEQLFGILFALIYTFSFIRNSSVMYRWGVGEYIAYIFIPPLFLCFYNLLRQQPKQLRWVIIFFSLILYSHVLSIVTTSFGLCCVLFSFLVQKKFNRTYLIYITKKFLLFVAGCLTMTMAYWGPMLEQKRFQTINMPQPFDFKQVTKSLEQLIRYSFSLDFRTYTIGIVFLSTVVIILMTVWLEKTLYRTIGIISLVILIMTTTVIPWWALQQTPVSIIQYPGRFLNVFCFFVALYLAHLCSVGAKYMGKFWRLVPSLVIIILMITLISGARILWHAQTSVPPELSVIRNNDLNKIKRFRQKDYYPKAALLNTEHLIVKKEYNGGQIKPMRIISKDHFKMTVKSTENSKIKLPILYYKGIITRINNQNTVPDRTKFGTVSLNLKKGVNQIDVSYRYTVVAKISFLISFLTVFCLFSNQFIIEE